MKTFPLQSLTIIEAQQKQFALVDSDLSSFSWLRVSYLAVI